MSTRNIIGYVNLNNTVVGGHRRSRSVLHWLSEFSSLNKTLATTPREIISCLYIMLLMTNVHAKNISLDIIAKVLLRDENSVIQ